MKTYAVVFLFWLFIRCLDLMVDVAVVERLGMMRVEEYHNRPHSMISLIKTMKQTPLVECLEVFLIQLNHLEIILIV